MKKILVLEDEKVLLDAIKVKLKESGYEVLTARSVDEGLDKLVDDIDLIWLDHYLLGNKDGLDFISEIKNSNEHKNIPIFVVTNTGSEEKEHTYINLGADKYYIKSNFKLDDIVNDIEKILK